jgi:hypothetical protein
MHTVRRVLTVIAVLVAALAVGSAPAQATAPDPPCEWDSYRTHSTCDGLQMGDELWAACGHEAIATVKWATVYGPGGIRLADVYLDYLRGTRTSSHPGGVCRLAAAFLAVDHPEANCYVKVERTSDGQAFRVSDTAEDVIGKHTQSVYDAGVTSYAWARCDFRGGVYTAQTGSY